MAWDDRLQSPRYASPSGAEFNFLYSAVSVEFDKRTSEYQFPDVDGSFIQDLGVSGKRYPLKIVFSGANYDLFANAFEAALAEKGIGRLYHPVYGTHDVVPFGTIIRTDDMVNECNQCTFTVTFFSTTGAVYPSAASDGLSDVKNALELLKIALAADLEGQVKNKKEKDRNGLAERFSAFLKKVKSAFKKITDAEKSVSDKFNNVYNSINEGIDVLVGEPAMMAFQVSVLLSTPGNMFKSVKDRLNAYGDLLSGLIDGADKTQPSGTGNTGINNFANDNMFACCIQSGQILTAATNDYTEKDDAIANAETIIDSLDRISVWREGNYAAIAEVDSSDVYQALLNASALAAGYLLQLSANLQRKFEITVTSERSILDVCAQVYGAVDSKLDFFISTNDLTGDEIIELPRGRKIVYYK